MSCPNNWSSQTCNAAKLAYAKTSQCDGTISVDDLEKTPAVAIYVHATSAYVLNSGSEKLGFFDKNGDFQVSEQEWIDTFSSSEREDKARDFFYALARRDCPTPAPSKSPIAAPTMTPAPYPAASDSSAFPPKALWIGLALIKLLF